MKTLRSLLAVSLFTLGLSVSHAAVSAEIMQPIAKTPLENALTGNHRSEKNKARDIYRHPEQTLLFLGFNSTMSIVELAPGGGWYTEILAPALKGKGKLYAAHYPDTGKDNYYSKSRRKLEAKLVSNEIYNEVILTDFIPRKASTIAPEGSVDMVLTFRNLHNWKEAGVLQMYKDAYLTLKSGGIMGVIEHRMPASQTWSDNKKTGYFPESLAISLAQEAGFTLLDRSEINANPKDNAMHPKGVWTLPPVLRLGEKDKEKYLAIGESDRMTLKFIKP